MYILFGEEDSKISKMESNWIYEGQNISRDSKDIFLHLLLTYIQKVPPQEEKTLKI